MDKHYNLEKIEELAGDDQDFIKDIVSTFLNETPSDLNNLKLAFSEKNHVLVYQSSHKIKPNLDLFGIDLINHAKAIEKWGLEKKDTPIDDKISHFIEILELAINQLKNDYNL